MTTSGEQNFTLKFYQTLPHSCSYLAGREATTLFLDPEREVNDALYTSLTLMGFRRSGRHLYRPHCQACQACQSVRIPVAAFSPNRQQRKIWRRNQDLHARRLPTRFNEEHYALYQRYLEARHADGDMYPPSLHQYQSFLMIDQPWAELIELRDANQRLLGVAAVDYLQLGLSAIYTFFAPEEEKRSLGTYAILWQIEQTRQLGLEHLYLGYWIQNCRKMRYKQNFQPLEVLQGQHWRPLIPIETSEEADL
ncbi:arginyltransferase [Marinospirillum sp. MEB164]|uniref:Aspartate/glutamate leucyltransferase n=1 Tax=Marinospirillum alkalitolerans TaxID=3123374 RepID=A0ABW8PX86_9GAMM